MNEPLVTATEPQIHYYELVTSTFDVADALAAAGQLGPWDSVCAAAQSAGRGQMRRQWVSPPGNLYVSFRLPPTYPFSSNGSAVAVGALMGATLGLMGCEVWLKWPNDLVVMVNGEPAKVGGILVEDRRHWLIAGAGLNIKSAPTHLREDAALPAASLDGATAKQWPAPQEFWPSIVKSMLSVYKDAAFFATQWRHLAKERLLWQGELVSVEDGGVSRSGILTGLGAEGELLLNTDHGMEEIYSGSVYPGDRAKG